MIYRVYWLFGSEKQIKTVQIWGGMEKLLFHVKASYTDRHILTPIQVSLGCTRNLLQTILVKILSLPRSRMDEKVVHRIVSQRIKAITINKSSVAHLSHSLVEHLLGRLLEFAAAVHLILLVGGGRSAVCSGVVGGRLLLGGRVLVRDHALGADGILFGSCAETLVALATSALGSVAGGHAGLLSNDVEH